MADAYGFETNGGPLRAGTKVLVGLEMERDETDFISLVITDDEDGTEYFAVIAQDPDDIDGFFQAVETAKANWERTKNKGGAA